MKLFIKFAEQKSVFIVRSYYNRESFGNVAELDHLYPWVPYITIGFPVVFFVQETFSEKYNFLGRHKGEFIFFGCF